MIIKSMSRKSKSFSQLYDYLMRDENSYCFSRNTYSNPRNKKEFIREFMKNSDFLKTSRGKNYLYHELLSLEENNLSLEKQKEILLDLSDKYLKLRANHLSLGVLHTDKNHIHIHLMISANKIEQEKRVRLSKSDFKSIQATLEEYKNEKYKELSKTSMYQEKKDLTKEKQKEQEIQHRRNKTSKKDEIKKDLKELFKKASSKTYIENYLKNKAYEFYTRGKQLGVIFENKKYRLKTLGLDKLYTSKLKELEKIKDREIRREKQKQNKSYSKENIRTR